MTSLNNFTKGLKISLYYKKTDKTFDGEVVMVDLIRKKVKVNINGKLVLSPMKYLTIKEQEKDIQDCFLLNMLCDDIMDMILNYKKYMDKNYILKMLSKGDIKGCMEDPLYKNRMRISYFDVATKPKLMWMVDRHFIKNKKLNPKGLSKSNYYCELFKEKVMEIEDKKKIKKPNLNHKFQVGDILFRQYGSGYGEFSTFYRVEKLTPKSYSLRLLKDDLTKSGFDTGWEKNMVWIDVEDPRPHLVNYNRNRKEYEDVKLLTNIKEGDFQLLSEVRTKYPWRFEVEVRDGKEYVGYNYYTLDVWR